MVFILSILLFYYTKLIFRRTELKKAKLTFFAKFFWLAKERKTRTRNKGINKRNILSSLFFKCFFRFQ